MRQIHWWQISLCCSLLCAPGALGQNAPQLDPSKPGTYAGADGKMDADEALRWFRASEVSAAAVARFDLDKSGKIDSPEELDALNAYVDSRADYSAGEFRGILAGRPSMSLEEFQRRWSPPGGPPSYRFRLRREAEDVSVLLLGTEFAKAKSAMLSFTNDVPSDDQTWQARGTLFYNLYDSGTTAVTPSVTFDRVEITDSTKDVNSLVFRINAEVERNGFEQFMTTYYVRAKIGFATDFDLERQAATVECEFEPVIKSLWIGAAGRVEVPLLGPVDMRWRPILHGEAGHILKRPDGEVGDDDFARAGIKARVDAWPGNDIVDRVGLYCAWNYLHGFAGDLDTSQYFETGVSARLDDAGMVTLEASYQIGDLALTDKYVEVFSLGIGLKF